MSMDRRGFFASLFGVEPKEWFLGVQIVFSTLPSDTTTVRRLRELVRMASEQNHAEFAERKRGYYKELAAILLENKPYWEYGYWDAIWDDNDAAAEFDEWCAELHATIATETAEIGGAVDEVNRLSSDKCYIAVTVCLLLENHTALEATWNLIEAIPEEEYWTMRGFAELLEALRRVDFECSLADAIFVIPGTDDDGFSWEDLHGAGWDYLKPITP